MALSLDRGGQKTAARRGEVYIGLTAFLLLAWIPFPGSRWLGDSDLHLATEVVAAALAFTCGAIALLRYYSRAKRRADLLFLGGGFIGTAALEAIHAYVSQPGMGVELGSPISRLSPYSWLLARLFLGVFMVAALRASRDDPDVRRREGLVYLVAALSVIGASAAFAFTPLPKIQYPDAFMFQRPAELLAAVLFGYAAYGYLKAGRWRHDPFEHWIVLSLLLSFMGQVFFISQAERLFGAEFFGGHLVKILAYLCVLTGLFGEVYRSFRRVEEGSEELAAANEALVDSNEALIDRSRAQFMLSSTLKQLNRITTTEYDDYDELFSDYLEMGCQMLGLENGVISQIEGDRYRIRAARSEFGWQVGEEFELSTTFCSAVIEQRATVALDQIGTNERWRTNPFAADNGIESYIGSPVYLERRLYGTLCFSSRDLRLGRGFQEHERDIVEIMAQTVGRLLEREQAAKDREAVDQMKDEFLSVVSHELRTPLTSIRGALGLLAGGALGELPEKGTRMVQIAAENTDRLVRLINDILDIERITAGRIAMEKRPCDLKEIVDGSVAVMASMADEATVSIEADVPSVQISADEDRLIQTVTNLLSNAIKFSAPGTTVSIVADEVGGDVIVQVRDQGRGIPVSKIEAIFERFQQVDASDSREKGGTGLGLAICKEIVERHDGRIWVASTEGRGSTFFFSLPVSPGAEVGTPEQPTEVQGGCVLVVEDDSDLAGVLGEMMRSLGLGAFVAHSGAEASQAVTSLDIDLMILDVMLPSGDGYEVVKEMRQQERFKELPLIVYSALELTEEQRRSLELGPTEFYTKGRIGPEQVQATVAKMLAVQGA